MQTIDLENISIEFDASRTQRFYEKQIGFVCDCKDCVNYVSRIYEVKEALSGLDQTLGIDLTKDVGRGMDELMPHNRADHHLYVVPYYLVGKCRINGVVLERESSGPIWPKTKRAEYKMTDNLSLLLINTTGSIKIDDAQSVITMWLEFKTELMNK